MDIDFLTKLRTDFPQFNFEKDEVFRWSPEVKTIFYEEESPDFEFSILHELGHALCSHTNFTLDIELLQIENQAWQKAKEIASQYNIKIPENFIQDRLDTYRDWLHKKSLCPKCKINGFQQSNLNYKCPACGLIWKTNDSRFKNLRRQKK